MAKETYQDYQIWVLRVLEDKGVYSIKEIKDKVKLFFDYSEFELHETFSSGTNIVDERIGWANTYLHKANAITRVKRAHYQITDRGLYLLKNYPDGLNDKILMQYREFRDFLDKSNSKKDLTVIPEESDKTGNYITKCLKEGNPIVEALGNGFQTVIIRSYKPAPTGRSFLLFPTSFYKTQDVNYVFKDEFGDFALNNLECVNSDGDVPIKYYVNVEYVIEDRDVQISSFNDFHIWTDFHIYDYLEDKPVYIWLLRVYRLKGEHSTSPVKGIIYGNVDEAISLDFMKPVLSDDEFLEIKDKFVSIEYNKLLDDNLNRILANQEKILKKL